MLCLLGVTVLVGLFGLYFSHVWLTKIKYFKKLSVLIWFDYQQSFVPTPITDVSPYSFEKLHYFLKYRTDTLTNVSTWANTFT